jgi:predicted ribosomally synthesized peptide with nif11-like leader
MKTLGEFIQRLQDDAAFEKRAQAFDNGEELMAFVKGEGYDFTLEELTIEFKQGAKLLKEADGMAPAPTDAEASTGRIPEEAAFPRKPEAFPNGKNGKKSTALLKSGSHDFTREPPGKGLQKPKGEMPPQGPEEKLPGGWLRGGGGRHRGFSPQRLKSISGEEP